MVVSLLLILPWCGFVLRSLIVLIRIVECYLVVFLGVVYS